MDGSGRISFVWGDGEEHHFRLALRQLRELQDKTEVGPFALFSRIRSGEWKVEDLRQTIRLGLIGGGLNPAEAGKLLVTYVDDRPLLENVSPALLILQAALLGADGDTSEKKTTAGPSGTTTGSPSVN